MKPRLFSLMNLVMAVGMLALLAGAPLAQAEREEPVSVNPAPPADVRAVAGYKVYLPFVTKGCSTGETYNQGPVYQRDNDNPVRPAYNHAGKNMLGLRGYQERLAGFTPGLVSYGVGTDPSAPQFKTLFSPARMQLSGHFYQSYNWNYSNPPDPNNPGTQGSLLTENNGSYAITVLGLSTTPGETLRLPTSGYSLGGTPDAKAIVIYADSSRITLHYTRDDSSAYGYTVLVDNICTDPSLLSLYNSLDGTARNTYHGFPDNTLDYNLPVLTYNQPFGNAISNQVVVAIIDTGGFQDPRSCNDWWVGYGSYSLSCTNRPPGN